MIRILTGSVLLLLSVASAAGGFYGEINVGQAKQKSEVSAVGSFSGPEITLSFQLGYQFLPYLAIEGGYNDFGEVSKRNFAGRAAIDSSALNAGLKAILPLGELFSLYARWCCFLGLSGIGRQPVIDSIGQR